MEPNPLAPLVDSKAIIGRIVDFFRAILKASDLGGLGSFTWWTTAPVPLHLREKRCTEIPLNRGGGQARDRTDRNT